MVRLTTDELKQVMLMVYFEDINGQLEKKRVAMVQKTEDNAPSYQQFGLFGLLQISCGWGFQQFTISAAMLVCFYPEMALYAMMEGKWIGPCTRRTAMRWGPRVDFSYKKNLYRRGRVHKRDGMWAFGLRAPSVFGFIWTWREPIESFDLDLSPSQLFGSRTIQSVWRARKKLTENKNPTRKRWGQKRGYSRTCINCDFYRWTRRLILLHKVIKFFFYPHIHKLWF